MPAGWLHFGYTVRLPISDSRPTGRSRVARGFHPKKDGTTRVRPRKR